MKKIDLQDFIQRHNIQVAEVIPMFFGKVYALEHWIFNPTKSLPRVAIVEYKNGKIVYKNPDGYTWRDVVKHFESELLNGGSEKIHNVAPKYKLTDETIEWNGTILHRIECVADCDDVKAGEKGGFIESEENLSQSDCCWVGGNARVCGGAKIIDDAIVKDNALIEGSVLVSEVSQISGSACVFGNSKISGCSVITDDASIEGSVILRDCRIGGVAEISGDFTLNDGIAYETDITSLEEYEQYRSAINSLYPKQRAKKIKKGQLKAYLKRNNIQVISEVSCDYGTRFILDHCVFNPEHKAKDVMIVLYDDGAISYKCFHKSCADKTWKDVVKLLGPISVLDEIEGVLCEHPYDGNDNIKF